MNSNQSRRWIAAAVFIFIIICFTLVSYLHPVPRSRVSGMVVSELVLRPLALRDAYQLYDTATVLRAILSGDYDTSIRETVTWKIKPGSREWERPVYHDPVSGIRSAREYLYRLTPVPYSKEQIPKTLATDNIDTITARLSRLEYAGNCYEHSLICSRMLNDRYTTVIYTLKRDSGQLIDHVVDLIYYRYKGKTYGVTMDALMGIIGPVRKDGSFYTIDELNQSELLLDHIKSRKTKRYLADTAHVYSNLYPKIATDYYSDNGAIYYLGYDDMYILAPQELLYDHMSYEHLDSIYARILAAALMRNVPQEIHEFRGE